MYFVFQLRWRSLTTNTLQPTAVSWQDPAYQVSIKSLSQSLPITARAPPSQCVVYILSLLDWRLLYMLGEKKLRGKLQVLTISFCSESVWCSLRDIPIHSMFYYSEGFFLLFFLDQSVLNRSGFQRSQLFQLINF